MKTLGFALMAAAALAVLWIAPPGTATPEIAESLDMNCTACHDKPGSKLLTDQGKYFETMGTLNGYDDIVSAFGKCTNCHVRKPGSTKLTRQGKVLARAVGDMEELREWVRAQHPVPSDDGAAGEGR
ncbi:MAG: hypothetical protein KDD47_08700 [Acidobacteria bacterium]|nr:hypothetical protein [Acidobacteriota bacterium]